MQDPATTHYRTVNGWAGGSTSGGSHQDKAEVKNWKLRLDVIQELSFMEGRFLAGLSTSH